MEYGMLTFKEPFNNVNRKIIHIDMDAFYASVEERDNPSLKGKPLIIAHDPRKTGGRGVVTTANYAARKFGVHSAMSSQLAYEKCPKAMFIAPRMSYYAEVSQEIRKIYKQYTDVIEPLSLDEAYLDVTLNKKEIKSATLIARSIQHQIWKELRLTCSAGVSYNKFIAKIASDYKKPSGITVIPPQDAQKFLLNLPINKFYGVGKKTAEKLEKMDIETGSDLYQLSAKDLTDSLGKMGYTLYQRVRGIDNRPVAVDRERKSIGKESTFGPFLVSEEQVEKALQQIAEGVAKSLEKHKLHGRVVTIKIRYGDFETLTRQKSFFTFTEGAEDIFWKARDLWQEHGEIEKEIRLLGITVSQLAPHFYTNVQLPLWETPKF